MNIFKKHKTILRDFTQICVVGMQINEIVSSNIDATKIKPNNMAPQKTGKSKRCKQNKHGF